MSYDCTMNDTSTHLIIVGPQEFAELIGVTRRTVYRYINGKVIPAVKVGHCWKINVGKAMTELGLA